MKAPSEMKANAYYYGILLKLAISTAVNFANPTSNLDTNGKRGLEPPIENLLLFCPILSLLMKRHIKCPKQMHKCKLDIIESKPKPIVLGRCCKIMVDCNYSLSQKLVSESLADKRCEINTAKGRERAMPNLLLVEPNSHLSWRH